MVVTLIGYVRDVVNFVEAVKDAPREMTELNKRMRFLALWLNSLKTTMEMRRQQILMFTSDEHNILTSIMDDLGNDVKAVNTLYNEWRGNKGPYGLEFRFALAAKFWHELGPRKEQIASLGTSIEKHREDLRDALLLMGFQGINEISDLISAKGARGLTPEPPKSPAKPQSPWKPQPPLPVTSGVASDSKIIFIDPYNEGRGLVAEAMAKMMRVWTTQAGGKWPVSLIHSAGFYLRSQGDIEKVVSDKLILPKGASPMEWRNGGKSPNPWALKAMFDPKMCRFQVRNEVEPEITRRRSRGIRKTIFQQYDYIVVFHKREYDNLLALKRVLLQKEGQQIAPAGKGRIVHIGTPTLSGSIRNVLDVDWNTPDAQKPQKWLEKVAEIRGLTQDLLVRRTGWQIPDTLAK
jgi:protein-tyrosine-phosphatase